MTTKVADFRFQFSAMVEVNAWLSFGANRRAVKLSSPLGIIRGLYGFDAASDAVDGCIGFCNINNH
jgi:hypothetical protein